MYLRYYGFREEPFGSTPDPRFLFSSASHREAMASMRYSIETGRGFFALIAPPGMGKTTLLFEALEKYHESACTAFLFNTQCNSREFLRFLLSEVGIDDETDDLARLHRRFNEFLVANSRLGRRFILIVDEAQNLSGEVLETIRLLSDFETARSKLMQIVLAGQPELYATLRRPNLSQLLQRIAIISRIEPFTPSETAEYINHRLTLADYRGEPIFSDDAISLIARHSHGIPRLINGICFNALSLGYASEVKQIGVELTAEALSDLPSANTSQRSNQGKQKRNPGFEQKRTTAPEVGSMTPHIVSPLAVSPVTAGPSPVSGPAPSQPKASTSPMPAGIPVSLAATALKTVEPSPVPPATNAVKPAPSLVPPQTSAARPAPGDVPMRTPAPVARGASAAVASRAPSRPGERQRPFAVGPDPIPSVTAAYGRHGQRGTSLGVLALALLLLIGCAAAGYFIVRPWVETPAPASTQGLNPSPASRATSEASPNDPVPAVPAQTLTTNREEVTLSREVQPESRDSTLQFEAPSSDLREATASSTSAQTGHEKTSVEAAPVTLTSSSSLAAGRVQATNVHAANWASSARTPLTDETNGADAVIVLPQLIERVSPEYPVAASRASTEGEVVLMANVNERGNPQNLRFLEGNQIFRQAAFNAVSQWKYRPGTYNGRPAGMPIKIRLKFSPSE
jgi:general secretion pathway protein A